MISTEELRALTSAEAKYTLRSKFILVVAMLLFLVSCVVVSILGLKPPRMVSSNAPATDFSSGRAMNHVKAIAKEPHPIGSTEHEAVRQYILRELTALSFTPQVQKTSIVRDEQERVIVYAGLVHNVLARLKGEESAGAVLLAAHYDSAPTTPGASDNAAGVATLLETARALRSGPPLKNDVIFLFGDGEEASMLGARAFVKQHPWAKDVSVVLNFEARGTGGPVFMFETTNRNGWLINKLAKAAEQPAAASFMYDVYRMLPYDTEMRIYKEAGIAGLNFAYIKGGAFFHTSADDIRHLDERSVQHNGLYALALTRELGNVNLSNVAGDDAVYFDLLGLTLVHYPVRLVAPVTIVIALLFGGIVVIGIRKKFLSLRGTAIGLTALLVSGGLSALVAEGLGRIIHAVSPSTNAGDGSTGLMFAGLIFLMIVIFWVIYGWCARRARAQDLAAGGLLCWLLMLASSVFFSPGASYLFTWPLLASLIPLGFLLVSSRARADSPRFLVLLTLCAIPGIFLIVPAVYTLFQGIGVAEPAVSMILPALLVGLLIPYLAPLAEKKTGALIGAGSLAVVCLIAGVVSGGHDLNHPKPDSVFYGLNSDSGTAIWASTDTAPDDWTSQFFSTTASKRELVEFFPLTPGIEFLSGPAPAHSAPPPNVTKLEASESDGIRKVRLQITSSRDASLLEVATSAESEALGAWVNGQRAYPFNQRILLRYFALPKEGIELVLEARASKPLAIRVTDYTRGIAQTTGLAFQPRSEMFMASPSRFWLQDTFAVSKSYQF